MSRQILTSRMRILALLIGLCLALLANRCDPGRSSPSQEEQQKKIVQGWIV